MSFNETVFVIGSEGYLGSHLCKSLAKRGLTAIRFDQALGQDISNPKHLHEYFLSSPKTSALIILAAIDHKLNSGKLEQSISANHLLNVNIAAQCLAIDAFVANSLSKSVRRIVLTSSIYSICSPNPGYYPASFTKSPLYGASKAAVNSIARHYAAHLGPMYRVNSVVLGSIDHCQPDSFKRHYASACSSQSLLSLDDATGPFHFLLSDDSNGVTGANLIIDGGYSAL